MGKERQNSPSRQQGDVVLSSPLTCGIAVDAGPDQDLCFPGGQVQLSGSVSGPVLSYSWSPPAGLSDPFSLNPTAFVTQSTTYQLTASSVETDVNLIVNGDFEQGNTGFTSDYLYAPNDLSVAGTYSVTTSPALVWSNFPDCVDHTSGSGMSMVVNGDASPGDNIWCQTISVTPNSEFIFSFWATTLIPLFPGQLQIFVNGQPVSPVFGLSSDFCSWTFFSQQFSVGNVNSMDLCIVSQGAETLIGNDFALDDLVLHPICTQTDEVNINLIQVEASAPFLLPLSCANPQLTIQATASPSGSNVSYQWTTSDGNIVSGANTLNPVVDMAGTYTLSVTYQSATATCTAMATTIVINDPNDPQVLIAMPDTLSCSNPSIWIDGGGTTTGPDITYSWTTLDGHILSDPTLLSIQVDAPGTYILQLTDTSTGCTDQGEVLVVLDESSPQAVITPDTLNLNCSLPQAWLDGSASSQGASFTYLWQSSVSLGPDTTSDSLWVDTSGLYQLIVTDTIQQCSDTAVAVVLQDFRAPGSSLSGDSLITCYQPEIWLQASWADTLGSFDFSWETPDGHFASPTDSSSVLVDSAGTYLFVNTLLETGCSDTISFGLSANKIAPVPVLPDTLFLTCAQPALWLADGGISQTTYQYSWSVADSLLSQADSLYVQTAANYQLEILDSLNGCMALDSVLVLENTQMPLISLVPPDTLSCQVLSVMLDASASDQGGHLWPVWSTTSGNIVGDSMGVYQVLADAPGWYVFSLMDTLSGCFSVDSLFLQVSDDVPQVNVDYGSGLLGCVGELSVVAQVTSSSTQLSTSWTTSNGSFLQGADSLSIYVQQAGFYWFTVQDLENGCSVVEFFEVETDTLTPVVQLQDSIFLNCYVSQDTVSADIQTSSDHPFVLSWTDEQGNSLPLLDSVSVLVDQQGNYQLIVTDALNGCTTSAFLSALSDFSQPQIDLAEADSLTCTSPVLTLQPQVDAGGHPLSYAWSSSDGHIIGASDGASLQLDSAGLYQLAVQDLENGCTAVDSVQVYSNQDYPLALIAEPSVLDCATPELLLDGTASSQGAVFSLQWTSADGQIVGGEQSPGALIASEGTYILEVTNTQNGCVSRDTVQVEEDFHQPDLQLSFLSDTLNCYEPESQVTVSVNTYAAHPYALSWTDSSGVELFFADPQQVVFTQEGSYELTVTDSVNNCTATAVVELWSDMNPPQIDLGEADSLTCASPVLILQPQVDAGGHPLSYAWSSSDGHIIGASDGASLQLDSAGLYQLAVQDLENGCTAVDSVQVYSNQDYPLALIAEPSVLDCATPELLLDGTASSQGAVFSLQWTSTDGQIVGGEQSPEALIASEGTYILEVTNTQNGCASRDTVEVEEDFHQPNLQLSLLSDTLNCYEPESQVTVSVNTYAAHPYALSWTDSSGVELFFADPQQVVFTQEGSYELTVTDSVNNCTATAVVELWSDMNPPQIDLAEADTLTCVSPVLVLQPQVDADGHPLSYAWSSSDGHIIGASDGASLQLDSAGLYQLAVQDLENGCTAVDSVQVYSSFDPPILNLAEADTLTCYESYVEVLVEVNPAFQSYAYNWSTVDGHFVEEPDSALAQIDWSAWYGVEVTNQETGCVAEDSIWIEEGRVFPDAQASVSDEISCAMPEVMLSAEGSSMGDNMAYSWTSSEGVFVGPVDSFEVWVAASGSYLLEVVNTENGCSSWAVALVQADTALPALVLSVPDTISCDQPSVGLSANTDLPDSLAIWSWNVLDGVLEGDLESDSVQALSGGVYVVSLQNSSNACVRTDTVEVQMDTLPPSVLAGEDVYFPCEEESVWLLGSVNFGSPIVLQWETTDGELLSDPNQAILEVGAPGTYVLEAIDESNGCSSKDTVLVLQDWPVDFELDVVVPTCADTLGAISIVSVEGGIGPFVYSIDGGEHFEEKADFENLQAGSYVVVVEDAQACRLEELVSLSEPPVFTLEFAEEVHFIRYGESVLLSPDWFGAEPLHWTWEPSESLSCSDCAEPLASPLETTSYLVSVESEEGCRAEGKVLVVVDEREPIYMPNAFSPNGDGFNDLFGPHLPEGSEITLLNLSIYDRWGNLVFRAEGGGVWDGSFRGKAAQAGVYVYQLEALDREGRPLLLKGEVVLVR